MKTPRFSPGRFRVSCCWYGSIKRDGNSDVPPHMRGSGFLISMILIPDFCDSALACSDFVSACAGLSALAAPELESEADSFSTAAASGEDVLACAGSTSAAFTPGLGRGSGVFGGVTAALRVDRVDGDDHPCE